ncbi:MAG: hypothetical protein IH600_09270 [Bacteroidetes bacterium]|nr:hypothetical protein [Bacteroidota bacterium]
MKGLSIPSAALVLLIALSLSTCSDDATNPNDLGGDTNLELTQVGQLFPISLSSPDNPGSVLSDLKDSIVITRNDGGIVTFHAVVAVDTAFVRGLETELGIATLNADLRHAILETYVNRFNVVVDSTDKNNITLTTDARLKVTSEGIQEFVSSGGDLSRPFTIVKYNANVGDTWTFTNQEGIAVTRTVAYKSTTDDYQIGFWYLKVIKVEETKEDPVMEKITYVTNHKYGLVGVEATTKTGKQLKVIVFPPTL